MKLGGYLTVKESAELTGYSEHHIRYLIQIQKLDRVKIGSMWWITEESLRAYLEGAEAKQEKDKRYGPRDD